MIRAGVTWRHVSALVLRAWSPCEVRGHDPALCSDFQPSLSLHPSLPPSLFLTISVHPLLHINTSLSLSPLAISFHPLLHINTSLSSVSLHPNLSLPHSLVIACSISLQTTISVPLHHAHTAQYLLTFLSLTCLSISLHLSLSLSLYLFYCIALSSVLSPFPPSYSLPIP